MYSRWVPWSPCLIRYSPSLKARSARPGFSTSSRWSCANAHPAYKMAPWQGSVKKVTVTVLTCSNEYSAHVEALLPAFLHMRHPRAVVHPQGL